MRPLFTMWASTRMVVLMALSAALYAAILIPFKFATIIPGLSEIRPGVCIPVVTGILFGPAACWGAGLGNLIGDVAGGMFGPGSAFGFAGNFMLAYVPWKLSEAFELDQIEDPLRRVLLFGLISVSAAAMCALITGWGINVLGFVPFAVLGTLIFLNNSIVSVLLGPPLLTVLMPRATRWGLRYRSIMDIPPQERPPVVPAVLLAGLALVGFATLFVLSPLNPPLVNNLGGCFAALVLALMLWL